MVARGAGDVGCAHCTTFGANETCRVCKLQVCDKCAADWTTCNEQAARVLRLGMGWRVRDVDPNGRYALVSRALKTPRIVDLRALKWLGQAPLLTTMGVTASYPPRLTSDQLIVYANLTWVTSQSTFVELRYRGMLGGQPDVAVERIDGPLGGHTCVSAVGDRYARVTDSQRVVVVEHSRQAPPPPSRAADLIAQVPLRVDTGFRTRVESYEPLPRKVVSAIHVDGERDRLASATWREVALHHMFEGKLERLDHIDTKLDANITFLAITGRFLAYAAGSRLEVRALSETGTIGEVVYHLERPVHAMALSRDGAYLAIGTGDTLIVHDLERGRTSQFEDHSDKINYVRFAADDHVMISADTDNRVVLRPRIAEGYAKPAVDVELAH